MLLFPKSLGHNHSEWSLLPNLCHLNLSSLAWITPCQLVAKRLFFLIVYLQANNYGWTRVITMSSVWSFTSTISSTPHKLLWGTTECPHPTGEETEIRVSWSFPSDRARLCTHVASPGRPLLTAETSWALTWKQNQAKAVHLRINKKNTVLKQEHFLIALQGNIWECNTQQKRENEKAKKKKI